MAQWYLHNHRLLRDERDALAAACPLMMLRIVGPGFPFNSVFRTPFECAVAHGTYTVHSPNPQAEVEYGISLWLPESYPREPKLMFCNDPKLPIKVLDRHILLYGQACLEVQPEIRRRWPPGSNLVGFLKNLVDPFLAWQTYYHAFGKPPEWGERAHGIEGIIDYYASILGVTGNDNIKGFMKLLARKNRPKGHEPCPCNSGLKLRNCHRDSIYKVRKKLHREDIVDDLEKVEIHANCSSMEKR